MKSEAKGPGTRSWPVVAHVEWAAEAAGLIKTSGKSHRQAHSRQRLLPCALLYGQIKKKLIKSGRARLFC